jgi:UDP-N-acetylglucosamine diphosphorylase / glucose-1-phosphate thymidylyltransferase / UDP-N-acetylgalactosamine diphosphorylase / glucosamine-1-phosphate N-acetyltransferase / galactosamine-1-phosphate N-acetyltransferase
MHICIFEDNQTENFYPLSLSHPVYDLLCGIKTLREKILCYFPNVPQTLFCRKYLEDTVKQDNPGIKVNSLDDVNYLFINGRVLIDEIFFETIGRNSTEKVFVKDDTIVAARITSETIKKIKSKITDLPDISVFEGIPQEKVVVDTVNYIWDLITLNGSQLRQDFNRINAPGISEDARLFRGVHLINKDDVIIETGTVIKPGVVIDASHGPVYIGKDVEIYPNSVIEGPVYIGDKTKIKSCAVIYENVSIGRVCKVGGEVEDSIILPYSNKQHSGFLGHSYLGNWINIGADTNCSDLKNNYSTIKVTHNDKQVDTGLQFLGLIMGDHSKTGINTMFNTGTITGFSCNIFGGGYPGKNIPSFSWGGKEKMETYDVEKSIDTSEKVMHRRKVEITTADKNLFKHIFSITENDRKK